MTVSCSYGRDHLNGLVDATSFGLVTRQKAQVLNNCFGYIDVTSTEAAIDIRGPETPH